MGLAKLQIWINSEGDPCKISERDEHDNSPWVVAIWHCDGDLLEWCGKKYYNMVAKCGHLEVDVPPGCYVIRAADGMSISKDGQVVGNHWSDHAVVTACCDENTCITLFAPSAHSCGIGFLAVLDRLIIAKKIPADIGKEAVQALNKILEKIPKTKWDNAALPVMATLLKDAENPKKRAG
jgi:hypothetical protein